MFRLSNVFLHLKRLDWKLILAVLGLAAVSLAALYSSCSIRGDFSNFYKQMAFFGLGFLFMIGLSFMDWRVFKENSFLILSLYFLCILLLIGVFFFAAEIRGTRSWYKIGSLSFDPIDLTKLVLILLLAKYFSRRHIEMYKIQHIFLSGFYVILPVALVFIQPNIGSASLLLVGWLGILLVSGVRVKHFLLICLAMIIVAGVGWNFFLHDYQRARITSFIFPQADPFGASWSQQQALIAVGSGGFFGQGWMHGSQTHHGFLTEPQTDFIFSAIAEEFGLIGVAVLAFLFGLFFWRVFKIALQSGSNFVSLFASGFAVIIFAQMAVNMAMNLGIAPIVGISLPFVSYGGSNLFFIFASLGILQSIKASS
ncbi:MAG: FtsW/RodA/SpoVE family cell cycle protein [Candidatus Paceibacterota bacterium]|jgi:rod shape determining protein RodA